MPVTALAGNSDNASAVLSGHAMSGGNVVLKGWTLSSDSFWASDLPLFALFATLEGIRPTVMHQVPMLVAVAVILMASVSAAVPLPRAIRWSGAFTTTFLVLGLPGAMLARYLLEGPQHVGTTLFCLVAFLALCRMRLGAAWVAGVVVLAAALVGDPFTLALGVIPLALTGLVVAAAQRRWRAGVAPIGAAAGAVALAEVVTYALHWLGGYVTAPLVPLAGPGQWVPNIRYAFHLLWDLVAGQSAVATIWDGLLLAAHGLGAAVVVAGVMGASGRLIRDVALGARADPSSLRATRRLEHLLALAFWGDLGLYALLRPPGPDAPTARYLVPGLVFAAILGGRFAATSATYLQAGARSAHRLAGRHNEMILVPGLLAIATAGYALSFASLGGLPTTPNPARSLARWLTARGLHHGIGDYWASSLVTVDSDNRVRVRPVLAIAGHIQPYHLNSNASWYPRGSAPWRPGFLVWVPSQPLGGVNATSASTTFGPPAWVRQVGPYQVLGWTHPRPTASSPH